MILRRGKPSWLKLKGSLCLSALWSLMCGYMCCCGQSSSRPRSRSHPRRHRSLNVREEYSVALRSNSYTEILTGVQRHLKNPKRRRRSGDYTHLLEPRQEALSSVIPHAAAGHRSLLSDYFDASFHAANFCGAVIESVHQARADHRILRQALDLSESESENERSTAAAASGLVRFSELDSPFSGANPIHFRLIHEGYAPMVRQLMSAHRAAMRRTRSPEAEAESREAGMAGAQLDAAARGAFALDRGFDTMGRMVRRVDNEIERGRDVVRMLMGDGEGELMVREVVKELQGREGVLMDQLAELEEHVYLCFLNINRARRMVLAEINAPVE